jgi:outer membrane protein OmpA-like peptidoglycan-associated protein
MRLGVAAAIVALSMPAAAEPLEWSAFFGVDKLPSDIGLGSMVAPEQRPQTAPIVGGRLTYVPLVAGPVAIGVEGELAITTSWTGYGFEALPARPSYFAPLFGYRGDVLVRLFPDHRLAPHVLGGGGGVTVATSSPFMSDQTHGAYFWGAGFTLKMQDAWLLRVDGRQEWLPAMSGDRTIAYELHVAVGRTLGQRPKPLPPPPPPPDQRIEVKEPPPPVQHEAAPTPPPLDSDGDGIPDAIDKCPTQPEDKDGFQDEDGCPDIDNDHDGIPDAIDKCPNEPETKNDIADDDGCPDEMPPAVAAAFEAATAVRFEPGKARMTKAGKAALGKTLGVLRDQPMLKVIVVGHDANAELAKKRAEAVKWYFVDQGVAQDQIDTVAGVDAKDPIEIMLR